ncbi:MAG: right-handed parallel beta-helix repeat-containing protein [Patescibacteria group bacterium]|nr:right-handed parallel beta-helix repeat-containing protein [Patescibacteria group bacterium]
MNKFKKIIPAVFIVFGMTITALTAYYIQYQQELRSSAAIPETIYVRQTCDPTDPECAVTVNDALGRVHDGWTIQIEIPVYDDMAIISPDYLNPDLLDDNPHEFTIRGKGVDQTTWKMTLEGVGNGHTVHIERLNKITINFKDITFDSDTFVNSTIHIYGHNTNGGQDPNPNTDCTFNFENIKVLNSKAAGIYFSGENSGSVKSSYFSNNEWPGVSVHGNGKVTIEDSKFENHQHQGIDARDNAFVAIKTSEFSGNNIKEEDYTKGAIYFYQNSEGSILSNKIQNNAFGIILSGDSKVQITDNIIKSNHKCGIYITSNSNVGIVGNQISENTDFGVQGDGNVLAVIKNNLVYNNTKTGIKIFDNTITQLINNNAVGNGGHGIDLLDNVKGTVLNNISAFNEEGGIRAATQSNFTSLEYNLAFGNAGGDWNNFSDWPPATNLTVDPKFVNQNDYHLQTGSPAIDAGHPDADYNDPDGSKNDIGAYGGPGACNLDPDLPGCLAVCTPQCDGKECGDDGCGGTCPFGCSNDHGSTQCDSGLCNPTCDADWGNCDGINPNGCETDLLNSNSHCGQCGNACGAGQTCQTGTCVDISCTTDEECKPDCSGVKRAPYMCDTALSICVFGDPLVCDKECGAECTADSDCSDDKVCDTSNCTCKIPPMKCAQNSDCDDENDCTIDTCNILSGVCSNTSLPDGTICSSCEGDNCKCDDGICKEPSSADCSIADIWGEESKPDGKVSAHDLSLILANWKWQKTPKDVQTDIWGEADKPDGMVNAYDLSKVLGCWTKH